MHLMDSVIIQRILASAAIDKLMFFFLLKFAEFRIVLIAVAQFDDEPIKDARDTNVGVNVLFNCKQYEICFYQSLIYRNLPKGLTMAVVPCRYILVQFADTVFAYTQRAAESRYCAIKKKTKKRN